MRKINFLLLLLQCLSAATAQQPYSKAVNEQITRVETSLSGGIIIDGKTYILSERMKHYNVPGLSVAVIDNYKIVWAKGYCYADKKEKRKVTANTLFEPGSISKSLNAVAILQLAQQGKLDLYQDINQYLVNWKFPYDTVSHGKKITTAQLLSHTAGLVYNWSGFKKPEQITTVPVNDTITSKYIGEYITDGFFSEIKKEKDGLYFWTDGISSKMYFTSSTDFRNIELGDTKTFTFDSAGTVTGFSNTFNGRLGAPGQRITTLDTLKPRPGQSGIFGRHLLETKNYDKAIGFLSKGMASEPSDSSLVKNLAHSFLFKGDFTKAIGLYRQYLKSGGQCERVKQKFEK